MSIDAIYCDHVRLERRAGSTGVDVLGHPLDAFDPIEDFWCLILRAGFAEVAPFSLLYPQEIELQIAGDRLQVLYSPSWPAGKRFRISARGNPGAGADHYEGRLYEEIEEAGS